ncbi:hypothetical protein [Staphylococcus hyicus]|uniref:hypothetical protein n=1 Tax=Staphylococcus hyicus TaxID=1284 RepID=UPI003133009E
METKRTIIYVDQIIIDEIEKFTSEAISMPRGKVINIAISFLLQFDKKEIKKYISKAYKYIDYHKINIKEEYGEKRKNKKETQLQCSPRVSEMFSKYHYKVVVIAALIFVGILKDGD